MTNNKIIKKNPKLKIQNEEKFENLKRKHDEKYRELERKFMENIKTVESTVCTKCKVPSTEGITTDEITEAGENFEKFKIAERKIWEKESYRLTTIKEEDPINYKAQHKILFITEEEEKITKTGKRILGKFPIIAEVEKAEHSGGYSKCFEQSTSYRSKTFTKTSTNKIMELNFDHTKQAGACIEDVFNLLSATKENWDNIEDLAVM